MAGRPITGETRRRLRDRAVDLYTGGMPYAEVARELGLTASTTRNLLKEARITFRRPGTYDRTACRKYR